MNSYKKINVYFRTCSFHKENLNRPHYFNYESVWANFLTSINWDLCNVAVLFEGNYDSYFIKNYEKKYHFKLKFIDSSAEKWKDKCFEPHASWSRALAVGCQVIKNDIDSGLINRNDLIALLDDDYAFVPGWDIICLDYISNFLKDDNFYLSPYC